LIYIFFQILVGSRRTSYAFQHSVNAINFDKIKDLLGRHINKNNNSASPKPARKISRAPFINSPVKLDLSHSTLQNDEVQTPTTTKDEMKPVLKIAISGDTVTRELERLLRIARRDNEELIRKNRALRSELKSVKDNKELFKDERQQNNENDDVEVAPDSKYVDTETIEDLQHAYELSDANCAFLEKQNHELANRLQQTDAVIEQHKHALFDQNEELDCAQKEKMESGKKADELRRQVTDLQRENEFLETDLEYLKAKLTELNGKEILPKGKHIYPSQPISSDHHKADFDALLVEKDSLVRECEALTAKVKFLEAENKYALEEARLFQRQIRETENASSSSSTILESPVPTPLVENVAQMVIVEREKTDSFIENEEVKSEGLAKKFKALKRDNSDLRKELENLVTEKLSVDQRCSILQVEHEALKSATKELEDKIIELEQPKSSGVTEPDIVIDLGRRLSDVIDAHHHQPLSAIPKELQAIKEGAILVSQANEEIKETNGVLLRRNSNLRRESLAAVTIKKEVEILREKLNSLETENTVLKMESMKQRGGGSGKRGSLSRQASRAWPGVKAVMQLATFNRATQTETQTPHQSPPEKSSSVDLEELEFVIEDLTKRNTELNVKHRTQERLLQELNTENQHLEDVNLKVMERNSLLKDQLEQGFY